MTALSHSQFRSLGFYAISWIETFLVHGPGDVQGQPIELDDEFATFILKAYSVSVSGSRMVRRAFLSRSKGRSKSGLAAMIECFEALGECRFDHWAEPGEVSDWGYEFEPGEPVGRQLTYVEALNVATEESQAGNTYDAVYYMLNPDTCSLELLDRFGPIDVGLTKTNLPDSRGFIEPVTASNESKDGGKSTFIVADETHLWIPPASGTFRLGKMHQTMVRNLFKRKEASGWMLETSTMYAQGEKSVAEGTHDYAKLLAKSGRGGKLLFDHRQASDHWNLDKRSERIKALEEAYGPAAAWMDLEAIADYWDDPQASEAEFKRFWLNQPVPLVDPTGIPIAVWALPPLLDRDVEAPTRAVIVIHVDQDCRWSSIGTASDVEGKTLLMCKRQAGIAWVAPEVARLCATRDIVGVAITPDARVLKPELVKAGIDFKVLTLGDVSAACSGIQEAVKGKAIIHVGQPELDAAVSNARIRLVGKTKSWRAADAGIDISPIEACSGALYQWGLLYCPLPVIY